MDSIEVLIERAKKRVWNAYDRRMPKTSREWLESHIDYWGYRIQIFMLTGSPPKGIVLVNYSRGHVLAFNAWDKKIYTYQCMPRQDFK